MLKFLIALLILIYIWSILDKFVKLTKITSCIDTLSAFLQSASLSHYTKSLNGNEYRDKLNAVLAKYPDIYEFTSLSSSTLDYGESDYANYVAAEHLCNELLMRKNFLKKSVLDCLNPISAIKALISFPSSMFNLLGFKIRPSFTKVFNILGWVITYLLTMYMDEIKAFINSLSKFR